MAPPAGKDKLVRRTFTNVRLTSLPATSRAQTLAPIEALVQA